MTAKLILSVPHQRTVKAIYLAIGVPSDQLPYTPNFELLYEGFVEKTGRSEVSRNELWLWLSRARKNKGLPKLRSPAKQPRANLAGGNPPVDGGGVPQ